MRFVAPTASPRTGQRLEMARVCLARAGLRLQVFPTSWRFDPPRTCWPCFMPDPLMGFTLQSFVPLAQPCAVSSAAPLLTLGLRTVTRGRNGNGPEPKRVPDFRTTMRGQQRRMPRLQGLAPRESPPPRRRWFRPPKARSSPGFSPLQGILPRRNGHGLTPCLPSCGFPRRRERPSRCHFRVLLPAG
jgi:hypothetical protein